MDGVFRILEFEPYYFVSPSSLAEQNSSTRSHISYSLLYHVFFLELKYFRLLVFVKRSYVADGCSYETHNHSTHFYYCSLFRVDLESET